MASKDLDKAEQTQSFEANGRLYTQLLAAGSNAKGQLGVGDTIDRHAFVSVMLDLRHSSIVKIAAGSNHTLFLCLENGEHVLYGSGDSSKGQLGPGLLSCSIFRPTRLSLDLPQNYIIRDIACAWETSFIVCRHKSTLDSEISENTFGDQIMALGADDFGLSGLSGTINCAKTLQLQRPGHLFIEHIAAGPRHVTVLTKSLLNQTQRFTYSILGWGACRQGQLGPSVNTSQLKIFPVTLRSMIHSSCLIHFPLTLDFTASPVLVHTVLKREEIVDLHCGMRFTAILSRLGEQYDLRIYGKQWKNVDFDFQSNPRWRMAATWSHIFMMGIDRDCVTVYKLESSQDAVIVASIQLAGRGHLRYLASGSEHVLVSLLCSNASSSFHVLGYGWNEHGNLGFEEGDSDASSNFTVIAQSSAKEDAHLTASVYAGNGTSWLCMPEGSEAD